MTNLLRWILVALLAAALCAGCGDDDDGESCAMQTIGVAGVRPDCMVWLECNEDDRWELDCLHQEDSGGMCVCKEGEQEVSTVAYDDDFCPVNYSEAMEPYVEAASEACGGWPY
jgi:hypothetical protein